MTLCTMDEKPEPTDSSFELPHGQTNQPPEPFDASLMQKATPEYLQELLKDKKLLQGMPNQFKHLELILEKEIAQVRERLFHKNGSIQKSNTDLPDPMGTIITVQRKVYIPVKENPTYNFVGRLLGPRGLTAKQMEQDLGCKIMVRGKGSMRDKRKEDQNRGKPNWEHLQEELHVLVSVEDYENRAEIRLEKAVTAIHVFLEQGLRTPEDKDLLKQTQLMELAVLNDKDRQQAQVQQMTQQQQQQFLLQQQYLAMLNNQSAFAAAAALAPGATSQLLNPAAAAALRFQSQATPQSLLLAQTSGAPGGLMGVMGAAGAPTVISPVSSASTGVFPAVSQALGAGLGSDQLAALISGLGSSAAFDSTQALSSFLPSRSGVAVPSTTPSGLGVATATHPALGEYAATGELDSGPGALKSKSAVPNVRLHPYLR